MIKVYSIYFFIKPPNKIYVINKNKTDESDYILRIHKADGSEKDIMPINSDQVFKAIHHTTITDYSETGNKIDKNIVKSVIRNHFIADNFAFVAGIVARCSCGAEYSY